MILDEHTAALDPKTADLIMELTDQISKGKKSVNHHGNTQPALRRRIRKPPDHDAPGRSIIDKSGEEKKLLSTEDIMGTFNKISVECGN